MAKNTYLVTGTDTNSGKTWLTLGLMSAFRKRGISPLGMKPVASGCVRFGDDLLNEDAELIRQYNDIALPYSLVNPYAFENSCSPNLAARTENREILIQPILNAYAEISSHCDVVVIEGVGGWRVPLSENLTIADIVRSVNAKVIIVVALRLGCINHTMLTLEAINRDTIDLAGWAAMCTEDDFGYSDQTLGYLERTVNLPFLGVVPFLRKLDPDKIGSYLDPDVLQ